jgi:hypothetical protein
VRKIAAAAVAIPFIVFYLVSALFRRATQGRSVSDGTALPPAPALAARTSSNYKMATVRTTSAAAPAKAVRTRRDDEPAKPAAPRRVSRPVLGAGMIQGAVVVGAVALLVTGLLIGLPAKQVAGNAPPSFSPLAPQGNVVGTPANLPLDVGIKVQFTKPMNQNSVEGAFSIVPDMKVSFLWDATGQVLSIKPNPHWEPYASYIIDITPAATDQEGLGLANQIHAKFDSGSETSGRIVATQVIDGLASPGTAFQLTFTRPVKLATVVARYGISPTVPVTIAGDDPTDNASQVFTMTPKSSLNATTAYTLSFEMGDGSTSATDSAGSPLQIVPALTITTMTAPTVVRFRPQDGVSYDTNQPISVRFTMPMDSKATAAAFSVTVSGKGVAGSISWAESNTVLVFSPRYAFKVGTTVSARMGSGARSVGGLRLGGTASSTFKISTPQQTTIKGWTGASGTGSATWYSSEVYYLNLMNCTRSGSWVTPSGFCSTETHHTLPAPGNLIRLSADISNRVSRPYAKYMADNRLLDHYLHGTTPHTRLCAAGYCGGSWGENIASPASAGKSGMVAIELFYQNEYWCRCEHYYNIMDRYFSIAGIGVWYSNSVRVSIDFYG